MVMGPTAGVVLADLGADVIKVEPVGGDPTRTLLGSGTGYFPMFNRNKRTFCLHLKTPDGINAPRRLLAGSAVSHFYLRPATPQPCGPGGDTFSATTQRLL